MCVWYRKSEESERQWEIEAVAEDPRYHVRATCRGEEKQEAASGAIKGREKGLCLSTATEATAQVTVLENCSLGFLVDPDLS